MRRGGSGSAIGGDNPGVPHESLSISNGTIPPPTAGSRQWNSMNGPWSPRAYVILDAVAVVAMFIVYVVLEVLEPRQVYMVTATMFRHSYPYKENSVPSYAVPIYAIGGPLVAFLVWKFVERRRLVTWYDWYRTFMACLFVLFLTGAVTNALKVSVARPRPNFFYQCWPNGTLAWQPGSQNAFGGMPLCEDPDHMPEYRKSFPSGHSSWSAAGLGFLSYWMMGQLRVFTGTGAPRMWSFLLSMVPFIAAVVVGVSRITDYWHNVADVCVGLVLGYSIALVCYLQLYPWFTLPTAHVPRWVTYDAKKGTGGGLGGGGNIHALDANTV